jgi:hypothetical protein
MKPQCRGGLGEKRRVPGRHSTRRGTWEALGALHGAFIFCLLNLAWWYRENPCSGNHNEQDAGWDHLLPVFLPYFAVFARFHPVPLLPSLGIVKVFNDVLPSGVECIGIHLGYNAAVLCRLFDRTTITIICGNIGRLCDGPDPSGLSRNWDFFAPHSY